MRLDKHAVVTLTLEEVTHVALDDFDLPKASINSLELAKVDAGYEIAWESSYGVAGRIRARRARLELVPGQPARDSA